MNIRNFSTLGLLISICWWVNSCGPKNPDVESPAKPMAQGDREIVIKGSVETLAGSHLTGSDNGPLLNATFNNPTGICADEKGVFYVTNTGTHSIRKVTSQSVTTLAGSGLKGYTEGNGKLAKFSSPKGICVDHSGNLFVADSDNHCIRKVTPDGKVSTLAGNGKQGMADGTGVAAQFSGPSGICIDSQGTIYVADMGNHRIRRITQDGVVTTLAGSGSVGWSNEAGGLLDGPSTKALFKFPSGIAVDPKGNLFVGDEGNHRIRKITSEGVVSTVAGSGECGYGKGGFADGPSTKARFNVPRGICLDGKGRIVVADVYNNRLRVIDSEGNVATLAGKREGYTNGSSGQAALSWPMDVLFDSAGKIYATDFGNHCIRLITPEPSFQVSQTARP